MTTQIAQLGDVLAAAEPGFASGEEVRNGLAQVRMNNITRDGELDWGSIRRVPVDSKNVPRFLLSPGDILFNSTNSPELVGKSALFDGFKEPLAYSNHFLRLRVHRDQVDPAFINYWLHYSWRQNLLQRLATRWVNQAAIRRDDLCQLKLTLPSIDQQRAVVARLNEAANLRRVRRYALNMCDDLLPAAFLKMFGDPRANPKQFAIAELGEFLSFVTSGSRGWAEYYVTQGARFIRSLDVRMNSISDESSVFVNPPQSAEAERTRVKSGDVLLTITGSRIGRVASAPTRVEGAFISQHVAILRLKPGLLSVFLSMFLSLDVGGQREIARLQYGQTKPGLNLDQIREFRIPLPSLLLQEKFCDLAETYQRLRAGHIEALRQADHLFQTLLHQAFGPQ